MELGFNLRSLGKVRASAAFYATILLKKLSKDGKKVVQKWLKELGADIVKNLGQELSGAEIEELIAKHGVLVVKWLGQELAGNAVKDILNRLAPDALKGIQDISGSAVTENGSSGIRVENGRHTPKSNTRE